MPKTIAIFALLIAALTFGCAEDPDVDNRTPDQATDECLSDGEAGQACDPLSDCCSDGMFCYYDDACNVETDDGCTTEGWCREKLALGEECSDPSECAEPEARCTAPEGEPATCTVHSDDLDGQRCEESADCSAADDIRRVCEETYCLRKAGEPCTDSDQCASNRCTGTGPDYTCS